ncbi:MAG: prepilin-type N-terminal cleavage/methylation domain-containing protein [Burkholderiales bacterium]|nr:prepilin-type N-terminal cleavage/methylation domain-containing protein [Burkholderiales bacterium]
MRSGRGFTLVELLVALGVMGLLAIMSWRGLDGMTRAHELTGARNDEVLALQTGLAQWGADLDAVVPLAQMPALEWNGRVLRITRRGTASVIDGIHVVAWARRDGHWLRWETPSLATRGEVESAWQQADLWAANPSDEQRRWEVKVTPLADWQLFYYRNDAWTNPQSSAGQAGPPAALPGGTPSAAAGRGANIPDGVRLVLELPPGLALAGRITRDWVNPTAGGSK